MPQLIKEVDGLWQLCASEEIDRARLDTWQVGAPLYLGADEEPTQEHASAASIALEFPAFNDGRALSSAVLLRTRFAYTGDIRAVGQVHEDILHYMVRCGFTSAEVPDERDVDTALARIKPYSDFYQQSVVQPEPQFTRVTRGTAE
jgi:uncharacterized protein (DUF934 family)